VRPTRGDGLLRPEHDLSIVASPQRRPDVSIITVAFNDQASISGLGRWLADSQLLATGRAEWLVVNNGPEMISLSPAPEHAVDLIDHRTNVGYGAALNMAAKRATGDVLILLNSDISLDVSGLTDLVAAVRTEPSTIWAPALRSGGKVVYGRKFYTPRTLLQARVPRLRGPLEITDPTAHVDWVLGACVGIDRAFFTSLGGFDPRYFLYFEDVDLCWRAWEAGGAVRVLPSVIVEHEHRRASAHQLRPFVFHVRSAATFFAAHPESLRKAPVFAPTSGPPVIRLPE
jgi:N-acetylglucosaminyl-diphospho-decaprenol L-rhamnosyltransferase